MLDACGVILDTNRRPQRPSQSLAGMSSSSCGEVVKRHVKVHVDDDGETMEFHHHQVLCAPY